MEQSELKNLEKKISAADEKKYKPLFDKQARYLGNGIYNVPGTNLLSTDTRELFIMFVLAKKGIPFTTK